MKKAVKRALFSSLTVASVLLMGASGGCLPALTPFGKTPGAISPLATIGGFATVSQCPSFQAYQQEVDPSFQRLCIACHAAGGPGASYFLLVPGQSTDNDVAAANFFVSRAIAVPTDGSLTVDSNNPDMTSPMLERLNGTLTHSITLGFISNDYASIRDWVTREINETCFIDPSSGNVTFTAPSPTPSS